MVRNTFNLLIGLVIAYHACGEVIAQETVADKVTVTKIWDKARHNAFADLVRWNDRYYCTFREGERHVHGKDGKVRVIASDDGVSWESVALFEEKGVDLRDPKITVTPDDRMMVLMGGSYYENRLLMRRLPRVAFFERGKAAPEKTMPVEIDEKIATNNDWLWRVEWHDGVGYGTVYQAFYPPSAKKGPRTTDEHPWQEHLVKTTDGVHYEFVSTLELAGTPGETALQFLDNNRLLVMVRNGEESDRGLSAPPYTTWEWKHLNLPLGGPDLMRLPSGKIILATRAYDGGWGVDAYTRLGTLTTEGEFTEKVRLPSAGDTSYPGMVLHDGTLWVSYYSSHEKGKSSIYLARIPLVAFE